MHWLYLSPHLDDVALSCGGLIWEQAQNGDVPAIWTICAGDPPPGPLSPFAETLHKRWGVGREAIQVRRGEDALSCTRLGAGYYHLPIPDCIYRRSPFSGQALYTSEKAIFGAVHPDEQGLLSELTELLAQKLHEIAVSDQIRMVSPMGLGGHVDHRLTRAAAERLGLPLRYYADYPYVMENATDIPFSLPPGCELEVRQISEPGMNAWVESVAAHRTQISTFWEDYQGMEHAIRTYASKHGGIL
ncbi:MAG: PIG-L deacetylase family protein, partial [Anaerolineales bacterium]